MNRMHAFFVSIFACSLHHQRAPPPTYTAGPSQNKNFVSANHALTRRHASASLPGESYCQMSNPELPDNNTHTHTGWASSGHSSRLQLSASPKLPFPPSHPKSHTGCSICCSICIALVTIPRGNYALAHTPPRACFAWSAGRCWMKR
jgi:hypothetical protein